MITKTQLGTYLLIVLMVAAIAVVQFLGDHHIYVPPIIGWLAGLGGTLLAGLFRSILPNLSGKPESGNAGADPSARAVAQVETLLQQYAGQKQYPGLSRALDPAPVDAPPVDAPPVDPNRTRRLSPSQVWQPVSGFEAEALPVLATDTPEVDPHA